MSSLVAEVQEKAKQQQHLHATAALVRGVIQFLQLVQRVRAACGAGGAEYDVLKGSRALAELGTVTCARPASLSRVSRLLRLWLPFP